MEAYFEPVVATLTGAGYRWYETANFCRSGRPTTCAAGTTSATGSGTTTSASASARSARSQAAGSGTRRRSAATSARCARDGGRRASSRSCRRTCARTERVMLGLRLDEPLALAGLEGVLDRRRARAPRAAGLVSRERGTLALTERGRFLGGGVTARLLA